jgi:hypothetical protein
MEEITQIRLVTPESDLDVGAGSIRDKQAPPGVQPQPMKALFNAGLVDKIGLDNICANVDVALKRAGELLAAK